jgi:hypothetical protein
LIGLLKGIQTGHEGRNTVFSKRNFIDVNLIAKIIKKTDGSKNACCRFLRVKNSYFGFDCQTCSAGG